VPRLRSSSLWAVALAAALSSLACRRPTAPEPPPPPTGDAVRLAVQVKPGVDLTADRARLLAELTATLGSDATIERLFPAAPEPDPEGLRRMFVVRAPHGRPPGETDWDVAYRVALLPTIERAEPDTVDTLEDTANPEAMASCQAPDADAPTDTAWSLRAVRAPQAWQTGARGTGVLVCHPDTGWTAHADLDSTRIDLVHALDLLTSGGDAHDPLETGLLFNPGHGTATGSVISSGGGVDTVGATAPGRVTGVAPGATLVPIRAVRSVVQAFDSDLARAIQHSVNSGCSVVSMSLGGRWFFGLHAAIRDAVRRGVIVNAAAGNCVRFVVAPASYDESIAVAGVNVRDKPWRGSSRGRAVDISAPAEHVWVATQSAAPAGASGTSVAPGQGTSFAVAHVAGAAALWIEKRGAEARALYGDRTPLQNVFRHQLKATARRPANWDTDKFGAGILDIERLLTAALPPASTIQELQPPAASLQAPSESLRALERIFDVDRATLLDGLSAGFHVPRERLGDWLVRFGPELVQRAMKDPADFYRLFEGGGDANAFTAAAPVRAAASAALRQRSSRTFQQATTPP
jgi:hypothetical protein